MDDYRVEENIVEPNDAATAAAYADISSALTMGIVAACLCEWPFASIAAIIIGFLGKKKVDAATDVYTQLGVPVPGKRIPARILCLVGAIVGIVMTVVWAIYFTAICAACICAGAFN